MPEANDMELVREFACDNSQAAFTELVRRHINLVYSVARRCTGDDGDAQDVTQAVFIILARKAAGLRENTLLTGWLYETTRFTAARLLRANARRHAREQETYMQSTLNEADTANIWTHLAPHLETAMGKLSEKDRALLVLRFYENKTGLEAAKLLGIGEDAAHKRAARAIEKLRKIFAKRGVTLTAAAIAGAVSANSVHAAPVALAKSVTAAAFAKGTIASGSIVTLVEGTLNRMGWAKAIIAIISGAVLLLGAGATMLGLGEPEIGFRTDDPVVLFGMAALLFWLCSEGLLQLLGFRQPKAKAETKGEVGKSVSTFWLFLLGSTVFSGALVFSPLDATILGWTTVGPALGFVRWFGVPLVAGGLIIRLISRLTLGKQFSLHLRTTPGHRLITTGIYRFIRHPFYLGSIFFLLGIPLCFGSVAGLACGLVLVAAVLHGIRFEEAALAGWFPEEYRQYRARTSKFFPALTKAQTAIFIGVVLLVVAGTATIAVKETAAYRHEPWRTYDLSVLDTTPPQVSILPAIRTILHLHWSGSRNGKERGLGQSVPDLLMLAYGVQPAQLIPTVPVPAGRYDFIASLTTGIEANQEALQQEIKKKFGLIGRYETIETNVLVLTVQSRNAAGLKPTAGHLSGWSWPHGYYSLHDQSISTLIYFLEDSLGTVVIDQTGLTNNLDIDFAWDSTPESLKQVLRDRLGLKLTAANMPVKMLVVEKAK